ncbi:MAG TPA: hypothetical protein PLN45_06760 [Exilispira sp.]|nr:hypothetical protein [Exilispira sp.]
MLQQKEYLLKAEHFRFFKNNYQKFEIQIENAQRNIQEMNYEAAIAVIQMELSSIKSMQDVIENTYMKGKELEFEIESAYQLLSQKMMNKHYKREFDTEDHKKVVESIDVSYWAEKEWSETERIYHEIDKSYQNIQQFDVDDLTKLRNLIDLSIDNYNLSFKKAEERFVNFLLIQQKQAEIAVSLMEKGYEIVDNIYKNDDERQNNLLLLQNERGEKR